MLVTKKTGGEWWLVSCLIIVSDFAKPTAFVFKVEEAGFEVSSSWCLPKPMQTICSRRRSDSNKALFKVGTLKICDHFVIFFMAQQPPRGPWPPPYRSCMITFRHTTLGRTPLDEWLVRRRDLYLTTHNTHNRQTIMLPAGLEPPITASERP